MIIYIFIATIFFCGYFMHCKFKLYKLFLGVLFFFTAFRNIELGGWDAYYYSVFFDSVPPLYDIFGYSTIYEWGYTLLNSIIKVFSSDYRVFQVCYTAVSIFLLNRLLEKTKLNDQEKCLFIFVYFCFGFIWNNWVTLRQNISNLLIWCALLELFGKSKHKWLIVCFDIIIAILFHKMAIVSVVVIPVILLLKPIPYKYTGIAVLIISIIVLVFNDYILDLMWKIVNAIFGRSFNIYLGSTEKINFINYLTRVVLCGMLIVGYKYIKNSDSDIAILSLLMTILIGSINLSVAKRVYEYFALGIYLGFTKMSKIFILKERVIISALLYVFMMIILIRFLLITDGGLYMNYSLFF